MGEPAGTEPELELELELEHAARPATEINTALVIVTIRAERRLYNATGSISCLS
jgi:hypothetical protein